MSLSRHLRFLVNVVLATVFREEWGQLPHAGPLPPGAPPSPQGPAAPIPREPGLALFFFALFSSHHQCARVIHHPDQDPGDSEGAAPLITELAQATRPPRLSPAPGQSSGVVGTVLIPPHASVRHFLKRRVKSLGAPRAGVLSP